MFVRRSVPALAAALLCLSTAPAAVAAERAGGQRTGISGTVRTAPAAHTVNAAHAAHAAQPAKSSGSYRYWSFWQHEDGKWAFAMKGPSQLHPHDGDVLGFRFILGSGSKSAPKPRGAADFDAICGRTDRKPGRQRVAVNVDFGVPAHAPKGEQPPKRRTGCASVPRDASAADALSAVAKPLRYDSHAMLCSVDGYPRQGCGEQADGSGGKGNGRSGKGGSRDSASGDEGGGLSPAVGVGVGAAVVVVLAGAATWQVRRRR